MNRYTMRYPLYSINEYAMGYGTEIDGCGRCMKYSLFFANLLIFIGGVVVAGLSIWALVEKIPFIGELVGNDLLSGAVYVLLVGGIVVAFIAFFGCIGASREIKCMLLTYFIIVFLLFVTMLVGGVLGYVFREKLVDTMHREMKSSLLQYDKHASIRTAWNTTQTLMQCCGVDSWRDWHRNNLELPDSCCREIEPGRRFHCNTGPDTVIATTTYLEGCVNRTQVHLQKHAAVLGGAGIAVALLMFFGMIFSCALFKMIE
ncbi:tetraspanin-9 isoform X2 [Cephus cinctus]|uniref:Tetraspanin n=1 Tax=Cephus cinctus TaxID=211228 RepID=A0AAJ7BSP7_CEPCN|nr:tetraspanin-9 isoform X2 [Cephus cinctus]